MTSLQSFFLTFWTFLHLCWHFLVAADESQPSLDIIFLFVVLLRLLLGYQGYVKCGSCSGRALFEVQERDPNTYDKSPTFHNLHKCMHHAVSTNAIFIIWTRKWEISHQLSCWVQSHLIKIYKMQFFFLEPKLGVIQKGRAGSLSSLV